jgi:FdhD protein
MKKLDISRFQDGSLEPFTDQVAEENILHLVMNSKVSFDVIITPGDIKEFVFGNLYSEGFINDKSEVVSYKEVIKKSLITVEVKLSNFEDKKILLKKNYNIVWTECGSIGELSRLTDRFKPLKITFTLQGKDILTIPSKTRDKVELFKQTGAYHYAFLFDKDLNLITYALDIGRHNAYDKVLGQNLLNEGDFSDKIIFLTGRISSDIILKSLRAGIPVVASRSAPLNTAVELAKKYNICMLGFLRGKKFNVYSNPNMIK